MIDWKTAAVQQRSTFADQFLTSINISLFLGYASLVYFVALGFELSGLCLFRLKLRVVSVNEAHSSAVC